MYVSDNQSESEHRTSVIGLFLASKTVIKTYLLYWLKNIRKKRIYHSTLQCWDRGKDLCIQILPDASIKHVAEFYSKFASTSRIEAIEEKWDFNCSLDT